MNHINTFHEASETWPSWQDTGRHIAVVIDGATVYGYLEMDEVYNHAAEDVDTMYLVRDLAGQLHDFQYADAWEFTDDADKSA